MTQFRYATIVHHIQWEMLLPALSVQLRSLHTISDCQYTAFTVCLRHTAERCACHRCNRSILQHVQESEIADKTASASSITGSDSNSSNTSSTRSIILPGVVPVPESCYAVIKQPVSWQQTAATFCDAVEAFRANMAQHFAGSTVVGNGCTVSVELLDSITAVLVDTAFSKDRPVMDLSAPVAAAHARRHVPAQCYEQLQCAL
jgi:hypothetical protein